MIGLEINGRLGNQLFRYAYARRVIEDRGGRDALVLGVRRLKRGDWELGLQDFNVLPYRVVGGRLFNCMGSTRQRLVSWLHFLCLRFETELLKRDKEAAERGWYGLLNDEGLLYCRNKEHLFRTPVGQADVIIDGYFENPKNFDGIRDILLEEFTPKYPELEHNRELYDRIRDRGGEAVCVSVRRGDYVSNPKIARTFDICGPDYFERAVAVMRERVARPVFFFFSDDISWVRENIRVSGECYYERGDDPVWEKLRLMYSCKHFIISNSTFSWWAQYLGRCGGKVVVSPDRWYRDGRSACLIDDSFVKVSVG